MQMEHGEVQKKKNQRPGKKMCHTFAKSEKEILRSWKHVRCQILLCFVQTSEKYRKCFRETGPDVVQVENTKPEDSGFRIPDLLNKEHKTPVSKYPVKKNAVWSERTRST